MAGKEKPQYGGTHFLGTGTYTALNQAAADELYSQLPQGSKEEQQALEAESRQKNPDLWQKDKKGR